ncbi:MAG TPA: UDP-N-acetylmuramoyl-L-alanyl-D-glutamate--2,6-diaminopimelate ligase [Verrucomicrobiae bacterium]|nr:UDP-N-acetylmuramoyl-L-alanyl-D-glutamate--2,6-diaminopimelate ligase [Verrucomicrobiae bacterium]
MAPNLELRPLPELLDGLSSDVPALTVGDVTLDSRQVRPGSLFLAVRGTRQHGLAFLESAVAQGAAAIAWEPAPGIAPPIAKVPLVAVENLSVRAGEIAARFFGRPSQQMHCIGVTGTDGKTSTSYLLAQAFEALGQPCLYIGTLGIGRHGAVRAGDNTTPDPVHLQRALHDARRDGAQAAAMEVSSHALDQGRVAGMRFASAILTNVGRDHLDYHGTLERYASAKKKLFTELAPGASIINRDDPTGATWLRELASRGARTIVYGLDGDVPAGAHVVGRNVQLRPTGLALDVTSHAGSARIESRLLGRFNAYNLVAAVAALLVRGVRLDQACAALSQAATVPGRIEGFHGPGLKPLVVVDYAHTPQALAQVLQSARAHCRGQLWCVFGCGGDRDRGKRPLMGAAAALYSDRVIVTDDNPRSEEPAAIVAEIVAGFPTGYPATVIHERAAAIERAVRDASDDDVVVVAGKGHEDYQLYGRERRHFSDREFVANLAGAP